MVDMKKISGRSSDSSSKKEDSDLLDAIAERSQNGAVLASDAKPFLDQIESSKIKKFLANHQNDKPHSSKTFSKHQR